MVAYYIKQWDECKGRGKGKLYSVKRQKRVLFYTHEIIPDGAGPG